MTEDFIVVLLVKAAVVKSAHLDFFQTNTSTTSLDPQKWKTWICVPDLFSTQFQCASF